MCCAGLSASAELLVKLDNNNNWCTGLFSAETEIATDIYDMFVFDDRHTIGLAALKLCKYCYLTTCFVLLCCVRGAWVIAADQLRPDNQELSPGIQ